MLYNWMKLKSIISQERRRTGTGGFEHSKQWQKYNIIYNTPIISDVGRCATTKFEIIL